MVERSDTFNAGQCAVLERVATGAPLPELLDSIIRFIESQAPGMLCSIVLLDAERRCICNGVGPSLPPQFLSALDGLAIGPTAGSCGAAAYTGKRMVVSDIATHPNWVDYRQLALPFRLRACWSNPILAPDKEVLGTYAMYFREPREPTEQEIQWVEVATHLASIAILRERNDAALRRSEARATQLARLYAASNAINEAIVRVRDADSLYAFACRLAVEQGFTRLAWVGMRDQTTGRLNCVARFAADPASYDFIDLSLAEERQNDQPAAQALRVGMTVVSEDIAKDSDPTFQAAALQRELCSCAAVPLRFGAQCVGVFVLYSDRPHYFRGEATRVLATLADDISFAVESAHNERERKRMEESIRSIEIQRALVYNNVEDIIFSLAVEGPNRYRFASVNPAFLKATGIDESAVVGKLVQEVIPESSLTKVLIKYRQAIERRDKVVWDEVTRYATGLRHGEVTVCPVFDSQGRCTNLIGTVHDFTGRMQAEEERTRLEHQLRQSQRVQSLGTLVGGIAHDFNNILTAISGNLDLALADSVAGSNAHKSLVEIQKASHRARGLVHQILTFSRREAPKRERLEPQSVIEEALQLLRPTLAPNIRVDTDFARETPPINADETQIHQIVMNLGINAAHAMKESGGTLRVQLDSCEINSEFAGAPAELPDGRYVRLRFSDRGCGMDQATRERAFEPFFTTKPPHEGTGLGLSVIHGIVSSHGGAIDVQSEVGQGTVITIYFPAAGARVENRATPAAEGTGERVMYVDDEEALTYLASRALSRLGYRVTAHSNSIAALQDFRARPNEFDVVVTDISMPGLSGPELARELRLARPNVPIVMLSGYIRPEDVEAAERLHINRLAYKPSSVSELGEIVSREICSLHS